MADTAAPLSAELELKRRGRRRLIGAITLGLLAFVFVPMFFDKEPRREGQNGGTRTEISVQIPPKDGQPPLADPLKVMPPPSVTASPSPPPPQQPEVAAPTTAELVPSPGIAKAIVPEPAKGVPKAAASKLVDKPPTRSAEPAARKTGFVVQVGAFSDAAKIKESIDRVRESGFAHYTETVDVKSGKVTRVRAGPFATKDKADAALARIKLNGGDGKIVPLE
jgi:DedD protein